MEQKEIRHVLAVMSGKGGVGKSTVTSLLAAALQKKGYQTGILDADVTGPSIPMLFGLKDKPEATDNKIIPVKSKNGIKIISINLLLENEDDPVIWRGPVITGVIKRFWDEVEWGKLDCLLVDLPPGTGDAPLTVMQSLPLDGAVVVTSPQDLANMVVRKAVNMARKLSVPLLGLVENMSYLTCPACDEVIYPFGKLNTAKIAEELDIPLLGILPIESELSREGDEGSMENSRSIDRLKIDGIIARIAE